jgi:hypothetical protein
MSPITRRFAFLTIVSVAATAAHAQGRLEGREAVRRFVSEKYGFSIGVPTRWLVDPSNDTPMYFSFSPSNAEQFNHQLKLPRGGAVISLVAQGRLPGPHFRSLSEWSAADARGVSGGSVSTRAFEMPPTTGVTNAIISSYDSATFGPDDQSEHRVNIFWEFRRELFAAHLLYGAHDPKGPEFNKVFLDCVRSIRPLEKAEHQVKAPLPDER